MVDSEQARRARKLLRNYLWVLFQATELRWTPDNDAEIEEIVDSIIEAAKVEMKKEAYNG